MGHDAQDVSTLIAIEPDTADGESRCMKTDICMNEVFILYVTCESYRMFTRVWML